MKRCFLIGSRQAGEEVWPALCQAVEEHVRAGLAGEFWVGQYGGFDRMAARGKGLGPPPAPPRKIPGPRPRRKPRPD